MINAFVKGQSLSLTAPLLVSDTIDYLEMEFHFQTSAWDGATKWAHFKLKDKETAFEVKLENDKITKDKHLNLSQGIWEIWLHGNIGETRITTEVKELRVEKTGVLSGEPFPDVSPTQAEILQSEIGNLEKLDTKCKENLVCAVNEIFGNSQKNVDQIFNPKSKNAQSGTAVEQARTSAVKESAVYTDSIKVNLDDEINFLTGEVSDAKQEIDKAVHTTLNVEIEDDGFGGYRADYNDNDINNHRNAGGLVQAKYYDADKNQTYTYYYSTMESDRKPTFIRTYINEQGQTEQVLASVGNDKRVNVEQRVAQGGSSGLKKIAEFKVGAGQSTDSIKINTDLNGDTFSLKHVKVTCQLYSKATKARVQIRTNGGVRNLAYQANVIGRGCFFIDTDARVNEIGTFSDFGAFSIRPENVDSYQGIDATPRNFLFSTSQTAKMPIDNLEILLVGTDAQITEGSIVEVYGE